MTVCFKWLCYGFFCFFFFQAEDGIRDLYVTGVQTCALPIYGLQALCVNPTTPIGEGDDAPTPTGHMVREVARGRYRATLRSGGLNLVDVHDVARGHVLALEHGRVGERYILGGTNLTLVEVFALIARA